MRAVFSPLLGIYPTAPQERRRIIASGFARQIRPPVALIERRFFCWLKPSSVRSGCSPTPFQIASASSQARNLNPLSSAILAKKRKTPVNRPSRATIRLITKESSNQEQSPLLAFYSRSSRCDRNPSPIYLSRFSQTAISPAQPKFSKKNLSRSAVRWIEVSRRSIASQIDIEIFASDPQVALNWSKQRQ